MIKKFNQIKGSINVITGCGSGLGRGTLQWFLRNQSGPILAIDRKFADNFIQGLNLTEEQTSKVILKQHDTFDEKQTEDSLSEFTTKFGPIDNVINIAGVCLAFLLHNKTNSKPYSLKHANDLFNFNTVGTFNVIRLASKFMINDTLKQKDSHETKNKCIINTSCISTTRPTLGHNVYTGSKAALDSMTLTIARELSPFNIRCNTINVGYFDTPLLRGSEAKVSDYIKANVVLCPGKLGEPEEFAHLVQTIVENQMINGACIRLDAGAKEVFTWSH